MSEIIPFRGRTAAPANDSMRPSRAPVTVSDTAAVQVVRALKFYAGSGFDHGEAARKALVAMTTVVGAQQ